MEQLVPAVEFMLTCAEHGGFSCAPGGEPRVFATAMATWALHEVRPMLPPALETRAEASIGSACEWLLGNVSTAGGWNDLGDADDDPEVAFTGAALLALGCGPDIDGVNDARAAAEKWILEHKPTDLREHAIELRTVDAVELRTIHLSLPWAIIGLASLGKRALRDTLDDLVEVLLQHQCKDASQNAGAFPWLETARRPRYTIWSTFRSVHAIAMVQALEESHGLRVASVLVRRLPD